MGAYSRWALIRGWALIKFSAFSSSVVCLFCNKTIHAITKVDVTRQGSCKYFEENSVFGEVSLISTYSIFWGGVGVVAYLRLSGSGREVGWGGRLFEAGRLLTFSVFRMGAYSRWALIRGWALIRINTVIY